MIVYLDGEFIPEEDAAIPIGDRGFLFSDGVFETALLQDGGFFRMQHHLQRFAASARTLRLPPPDIEAVDGIIRELARRNNLRDGNVRMTLTRGASTPLLLVTIRPPDAEWIRRARDGWSIATAATRRPSTAAIPAQLKSLGRPYAIMARHEALEAGADDALLLTDDGFICEGPTWNVFWRKDDVLFTPALDAGVLAGITRTALLELAPSVGLRPQEGLFPRAVLDSADEAFATMTSVGIVSIRRLDGATLPAATPAADALLPLYLQLVREGCAADPLRQAPE
jgi:branched-chain amino acid aminotransferase